MFFQNRHLWGLLKMVSIVLFFSIYLPSLADAEARKVKRSRDRDRRSGNKALQDIVLYKGESPCKVGGMIQEIDSKFCGFYDHRSAKGEENKIEE